MLRLRWLPLFAAALPLVCARAAVPAQPVRLGLCAACHGERGHARIPGAPNLAGQNYAYLLQALHEYRSGQRNVPVMRAAAGPLSETEMQALAHWYAAQPPCAAAQAVHP
jgi:cytochrome c553